MTPLNMIPIILLSAVAWSQQSTPSPTSPLSPEFSTAAIKALVAVKNQVLEGSDQPVQSAINEADVAASSKAEIATVQRIKWLSKFHLIELEARMKWLLLDVPKECPFDK